MILKHWIWCVKVAWQLNLYLNGVDSRFFKGGGGGGGTLWINLFEATSLKL